MSLLEFQTSVGVFADLRSYTRTDVELINRFCDLFNTDAKWGLWIQEGLGALLEVAGESVVELQRLNQVDGSETQILSFQKDSISIGRDPDNDVVIPFAGVGRHHARITKQGGRYFLEDFGSANGTYLNDAKLEPRNATPLKEGAQFLIFPDQFTFSNRQVWNRQGPIRVASNAPRVVTWSERRTWEFGGTRLFGIRLSPDLGSAVLRISQDLLNSLVHRTSHAEAEGLAPADGGPLDFLLLSVLERANRELRFPFYFTLVPFEAPRTDEPGVAIECVFDLTGALGVIDVFMPGSLLRAIHRSSASECSSVPVSWPMLASIGYSDLTLQEVTDLEIGDILLFASVNRLLLPPAAHRAEHGWGVVLVESNPLRLKIENYFERSNLTMESEPAMPEESDFQKPNLAALPVRVHIVLSQLEMSLAELNKLRPGSIVELDCDKPEDVQLAVNGKIAGAGQLVEIEGRLGVRISNWNAQ